MFKGRLSLEIRATEADVRQYLDGLIFQLPAFVARNPYHQEEVVTTIVRSVRGMYDCPHPYSLELRR